MGDDINEIVSKECKDLIRLGSRENIYEEVKKRYLTKEAQEKFILQFFAYCILHAGEIYKERKTIACYQNDPRGVEEAVACELLRDIYDCILNREWKLGKFGGTSMPIGPEDTLYTMPYHMATMLETIHEMMKPVEEVTANFLCIWLPAKQPTYVETLQKIIKISQKAQKKSPFSFFAMGGRDSATQEFYSALSNVFTINHSVEEREYREQSRANLPPAS